MEIRSRPRLIEDRNVNFQAWQVNVITPIIPLPKSPWWIWYLYADEPNILDIVRISSVVRSYPLLRRDVLRVFTFGDVFCFNTLEQSFEVPFSKSIIAFSLDELKENRAYHCL